MICEVGFENEYDEVNKKYKGSVIFVQKRFVLSKQSVYVHVKMDKKDQWHKIDLSSKAFHQLYHSYHFQKSTYSTVKYRKAESEGCVFRPFPISYKLYQQETFWNASYPRLDQDFVQLFHRCSTANEISENAVPLSVLNWDRRIVHLTEQILNFEQRIEVLKHKTVSFSE